MLDVPFTAEEASFKDLECFCGDAEVVLDVLKIGFIVPVCRGGKNILSKWIATEG